MQPASSDSSGNDLALKLRRFGPIIAIGVVVLTIIAFVALSGDEDAPADDAAEIGDDADTDADADDATDVDDAVTDDDADNADADSTDETDETDVAVETGLPEGVISFSVAEELGLDIDFGPRCDTERGTAAVPDFFAPECYQPFEGQGGATARGVTDDTITIVWWVSQDADPILSYLTSAIVNDDTNADDEATMRALLTYYETYYETYGRSVELIIVEGSGTILDENAARADAVKIDEELDPFMVWGGPLLTSAFAEELHARGIPCIGCGPSETQEYYDANPGLFYSITKSAEQLDLLVAEYIEKRLAGDLAIHAGDASMHDQERVFGRIWIEASAASTAANERFEEVLGEAGIEIAESQSYALDPATIQETAGSVITRLKEAGVTSVIFNGDPLSPREFTNEATAQNYFPEWIVTGSVLVDTAAFSRTYDQDQWANAFGISNLAARVDRGVAGSHFIYEWFNGEPPRSDSNIAVITPTPSLFYTVLQAIGPNLTIETFNDAIFQVSTRRAITGASLTYGSPGVWPENLEPDYRGVDDVTEIWWDATEPGLDEIDADGVGLWRYVNGGVRYLLGELPEGPPPAFELDGTVTIYAERPPEEATGDYEPLPPG